MQRSIFAVHTLAAVLALGATPALAQDPPAGNLPGNSGGPGASSRPSSGNSSGTAVERPSGGSSGSAGTVSSGSASSGGGSASTPSTGGGSSFGEARPRAPERRSGDYAVPRGMRDDSSFTAPGARTRSSAAATGDAATDQRRAVPAYSRPRDGRQPVGEAIDRRNAPARGGTDGGGSIIFYPYYDPYYGSSRYSHYGYGPWLGGYGFGLGYFYDPWGSYGYYSPYNYDYGYGGSSYGSGRYSGYNRGYRPVGNLRLKVKPEHGQVYVDGYFAGDVDSFDGVFQRLALEAGPHKVEIRAEGHEPVTFEVMVTPGETVTYKGELKRIQ